MQYEYIPGHPLKRVLFKSGETMTYHPVRGVNPERRARKRVCAHLGINSGRQTRKLRKRIRRGQV